MSIVINVQEDRSFRRSVGLWLIVQLLVCAINSIAAEWNINHEGAIFFVFASAGVTIIQVVSVSAILRNAKFRRKISWLLIGGLLGFFIPAVVYMLVWLAPGFPHFRNAVLWAMLFCMYSLFGVGMLGGAWIGYVRWKSLSGSLAN